MASNNASGEMVFDESSGISGEEQREIISRINSIAEKNRRTLAAGESGGQSFKAKKSGRFFPLLVNAAAVVLLAGGFLLLSSFQGRTDTRAREGDFVYTSAERALIEEIRKETASRIEAKEQEIAGIVSQMEGVETQIRELHSDNEELNAEQLAAEARLVTLRDEYAGGLAALHNERAHILEEANAREEGLRSQFEARIRELSAASEQNRSALEENSAALISARNELERLSGDQEKAAFIESQITGHFVLIEEQIRGGNYDDALETVKSTRLFLDTPVFQGIRAFQSRKDLYWRTLNSLDAAAALGMKESAPVPAIPAAAAPPPDNSAETIKALAELQEKNTQLEQSVSSLRKTIEASTSQGSGLAQRLTELEGEARTLRNTGAEKDRAIVALEVEKTNLTQTVNARDRTITTLEAEKTDLTQTMSARNRAITTLEAEKTDLTQTVSARDRTISANRDTITSLQSQINNLSQENARLIQQNAELVIRAGEQ